MKISETHKNGARIELSGFLGSIGPILTSWRVYQSEIVENEEKRPQIGFTLKEDDKK